MSSVFISHAEEDAQLVKNFAGAFEENGYSTWYFERDTLPGVPYMAQHAAAIDGAETFLLLISSHSLGSPEVTKEIELAYSAQRYFLPVLVDVTHDEMRHRQPAWRAAIGGAAEIALSEIGIPEAVARMIRSLQHWKIYPPTQPRTNPVPSAPRSPGSARRIWASDANQINISDLENIVFRNQLIDDFLTSDSKFFLSANKGLGKTLLLTYKRSLLDKSHRERKKKSTEVYFIPEGRPYLDFMSDLKSIRRTYDQFVSNIANSKRLWAFALRVSAISYHKGLVTDDDQDDLARLPKRIAVWVLGEKIEVTVVFKELLNCSLSELNRVIDQTENFLEHKFRRIHSGTFFFIDKVDQAYGSCRGGPGLLCRRVSSRLPGMR